MTQTVLFYEGQTSYRKDRYIIGLRQKLVLNGSNWFCSTPCSFVCPVHQSTNRFLYGLLSALHSHLHLLYIYFIVAFLKKTQTDSLQICQNASEIIFSGYSVNNQGYFILLLYRPSQPKKFSDLETAEFLLTFFFQFRWCVTG